MPESLRVAKVDGVSRNVHLKARSHITRALLDDLYAKAADVRDYTVCTRRTDTRTWTGFETYNNFTDADKEFIARANNKVEGTPVERLSPDDREPSGRVVEV